MKQLTADGATYKAIELHHLSLLSKSLERMVDHLILIEKPNLLFIKKISDSLNEFQKLLENQCSSLNCETALEFNNKINLLQKIKVEEKPATEKPVVEEEPVTEIEEAAKIELEWWEGKRDYIQDEKDIARMLTLKNNSLREVINKQ